MDEIPATIHLIGRAISPFSTHPLHNAPRDTLVAPYIAWAIVTPTLVIAILVVMVRIFVKWFIVRNVHLEDYVLPFALVFEIGHSIPPLHYMRYASGRDTWNITKESMIEFQLGVQIMCLCYQFAILTLKFCILIQFQRIFIVPSKRHIALYVTRFLIFANTTYYIVLTLVHIFGCQPLKKYWYPSLVEGGHCLDFSRLRLVTTAFNFALDAIMLVWTQCVVWKINMEGKKRAGLALLFFAGLLACISAGVRLYGAIMIFSSNKSRLFYWIDFAALCTYPEIASGFLILCLPVFPNFIKYLRTRLGFKSTGDEEGSWPGSPLDVPSSRMTRSWGHIAQSGLDYEGSNEDIVYLTADRTRSDGGYSELLRTKRGSEGADSLEPLEPDRPKRTLMRNFDL